MYPLTNVPLNGKSLYQPDKKWVFMGYNPQESLHPGRLTWNPKTTQLKRKIIFQTMIFRFHVDLPGCRFIVRATPNYCPLEILAAGPGPTCPARRKAYMHKPIWQPAEENAEIGWRNSQRRKAEKTGQCFSQLVTKVWDTYETLYLPAFTAYICICLYAFWKTAYWLQRIFSQHEKREKSKMEM